MVKQKCKRCGHAWDYTGKKLKEKSKYLQYTGCPKCHTSVKLKGVDAKQEEVKDGNDGILSTEL